ncbi:MAG: hypothetical protein ACR2PO_02245 [Methyloligellaceae bacterium]
MPPRRTLRTGLLVMLVNVAVLALLEISLRAAGLGPRELRVNRYLAGRSWAEPHPILGWRNREGTFRSVEAGRVPMGFEADGRRREPPGAGSAKAPKVLVVGGSFAQGYGVADGETFAFLLDRELPGHDVLNFGTGGYSTWQAYLLMRDYFGRRRAAPTALVIYGFISDHPSRTVADFDWITYLTTSDGRKRIPPHLRFHNGGFAERSGGPVSVWPLETTAALVRFAHDVVLKLRHTVADADKRKATLEVVHRMAELAQKHGARFLMVGLTEIRRSLKDALARGGIEALDCHVPDWWRQRDMRVGGTGHPSPKLHKHYAGCLAAAVRARRLIPDAASDPP